MYVCVCVCPSVRPSHFFQPMIALTFAGTYMYFPTQGTYGGTERSEACDGGPTRARTERSEACDGVSHMYVYVCSSRVSVYVQGYL